MVKVKQMTIRTYSEVILLLTFEDRFRYLKLQGVVGKDTFGYDRYLNQILYQSTEWRKFRRDIIIRDNGCDLGCDGFEINDRIILHHINPITVNDIVCRHSKVFDPENVICTSHRTHMAIHYSDEDLLVTAPIERQQNDTCPWRR